MKRSLRWLLASLGVILLTPFAIFPEIMGDIGPRHVPMWRNCLGIALMSTAMVGILSSLFAMLRARMRNRHALIRDTREP